MHFVAVQLEIKSFWILLCLPINHVIQHKWVVVHGTTLLKVFYYVHDSDRSFNLKHIDEKKCNFMKIPSIWTKKHKNVKNGKTYQYWKNKLIFYLKNLKLNAKKVDQHNFLCNLFSSNRRYNDESCCIKIRWLQFL